MIGRADIEGSKSDGAMNAWPPQASYPCGNFPDTSFFKLGNKEDRRTTMTATTTTTTKTTRTSEYHELLTSCSTTTTTTTGTLTKRKKYGKTMGNPSANNTLENQH